MKVVTKGKSKKY